MVPLLLHCYHIFSPTYNWNVKSQSLNCHIQGDEAGEFQRKLVNPLSHTHTHSKAEKLARYFRKILQEVKCSNISLFPGKDLENDLKTIHPAFYCCFTCKTGGTSGTRLGRGFFPEGSNIIGTAHFSPLFYSFLSELFFSITQVLPSTSSWCKHWVVLPAKESDLREKSLVDG